MNELYKFLLIKTKRNNYKNNYYKNNYENSILTDDQTIFITIVSVDCINFISNNLYDFFIQKGWKCNIIKHNELNKFVSLYSMYPNHYFFIFCIHLIDPKINLPKNKYIIYQLEQNTDNKLSHHYKNIDIQKYLLNSKLNLDYSYENINVFTNILNITPIFLPIPIKKNIINITNTIKKYDIVFIGSINKRRLTILNYLKKNYNIFIPKKPLYDNNLYKLYSESKILLNIHYYENAILEIPRINEALCCSNIRIISEKSNNIDIYNEYKSAINFIEVIDNNYDEIIFEINKILSSYDSEIINNNSIINNLENKYFNIINDIFIL
jgi:hypothetical protein